MGRVREGEGDGQSPATDQGLAAKPHVFTLKESYQYSNQGFAIAVEDEEGTVSILHLDASSGAWRLTDTSKP